MLENHTVGPEEKRAEEGKVPVAVGDDPESVAVAAPETVEGEAPGRMLKDPLVARTSEAEKLPPTGPNSIVKPLELYIRTLPKIKLPADVVTTHE